MGYQITPTVPIYTLIVVLTVSLGLYGALQSRRRGSEPALLAFIAVMCSICLVQLATIFVELSPTTGRQHAGLNFLNGFAVLLFVYTILWFALAYTHNDGWVNRWSVGFAVGHLSISSLILLVDPQFMYAIDGMTTHGPVTVLGVTFEQWAALERELKPAFLLFQLYLYAVILAATAILGWYLIQNRHGLYTGQLFALIVGFGTPVVVNAFVFAGVGPPELNASGVALGVTAVALAVAIFRYRLLRIAPIGRKQVVERLSDPVVITEEHRVVDSNAAARELVETPTGWRGMTVTDFFAELTEDAVYKRLHDGTQLTVEDDGRRRHFNLDVSTVETNRNPREGKLIVFREITEEKERQRRLERKNERLDQFTSVVSHDLRNPLNVVQLRFDLYQSDPEETHAEAVEQNLDRMEMMIDDLLTLARAGETVTETEPVSIAAVAEEAWEHTDTANCELDLPLSRDDTVLADDERLLHAFENLFRNAVEHGSKKSRSQTTANDQHSSVTVRVGTIEEMTAGTGGSVAGFYIEDDGTGIPEEKQRTIFEHGYTTNESGTGFGLSIVQDIVDAHGWDISVTDSSDGGARFEITCLETTKQ